MHRILVADDEANLCSLIVQTLQQAGYEAVAVGNGAKALELHQAEPVDLMVLDLNMPVMDGFEVLKALRPRDEVPVLMLTAQGLEQKRVKGFGLGADDYVVKPFSTTELVARIGAILRRTTRYKERPRLRTGPFLLDCMNKRLLRDGDLVNITPVEYFILELLITHAGQHLTREALLNLAWPADARPSPRTVDVHLARLRPKITLEGDPKWIVSSGSHGYCWTCPVEAEQ